MFSGLPIRTTVAALAVTGLLAVAPSAMAAPDGPSVAASRASSAGVVVKMPPAVEGRLGADSKELIDAVSADILARSHDAAVLTPDAAVSKLADEGREVVVDVRTVTDGWARGVAYVEASRARHGEPEGWLYLAHRQNGRWIAGLEGDREFAAYVARSPLVSKAERRNMTAYAERRTEPQAEVAELGALANTNGLLLPWMPDYYMTLTGGPHAHDGGSGYWSALDFAGGNASGLVRSSREGTATSMCGAGGGWTRVIHPGGFSTDYYHMRNTTYYNGTSIARSALLGTIGTDTCAGGAATGAHVHWSLRTYDANYNGQYTWLNGRTIGGWAWWNGSGQYSGCGTRLGVTACPGTAIYNRTS
ncbi:peptidase M23 [Streptomyces sp. CB00316]|uniref:M23 family metallopeptidase n=1 Tax=unclassified Streptomyces TaxID=2593676 RepID=UPI00093FC974|nr:MULTISPECIES: M23 family metallopeptidase [unclassified Streptomyces]MBT2375963.1 peptidoglycan DD-metalloendopeptidase family protein [Streptomyces sp. ISL-111]OKJ18252.1 peptidase M23 [Streptomyces sp. CB00316]